MTSELTIVRHGYTDTGGGHIHFVPAGSGDPLVLLPHGGRSSRIYRAVIPILAERFRVVALDPRYG
jgi:pimeloyl-ACP methyl ester carboxylesterase